MSVCVPGSVEETYESTRVYAQELAGTGHISLSQTEVLANNRYRSINNIRLVINEQCVSVAKLMIKDYISPLRPRTHPTRLPHQAHTHPLRTHAPR